MMFQNQLKVFFRCFFFEVEPFLSSNHDKVANVTRLHLKELQIYSIIRMLILSQDKRYCRGRVSAYLEGITLGWNDNTTLPWSISR
jgi:hypothetical protein